MGRTSKSKVDPAPETKKLSGHKAHRKDNPDDAKLKVVEIEKNKKHALHGHGHAHHKTDIHELEVHHDHKQHEAHENRVHHEHEHDHHHPLKHKKSVVKDLEDLTPDQTKKKSISVTEATAKDKVVEEEPIEESESEYEDEIEIPPEAYPPPYWEEKLAKSVDIITELEKYPKMKITLKENIRLAEEFMRHPDVARKVAADRQLANRVIERPELLRELAIAYHKMAEASKRKKRRDSKNKGSKKISDPNPLVHAKPSYRKHDNDQENVPHHHHHKTGPNYVELGINKNAYKNAVESITESSDISVISRATLPNVKLPPDEPESIKYLMDSARLYLNHHVEIADGCSTCCDKKREYYDVVNVYGRMMYRVYEGKRSCLCGIFRSFQMAAKEPNGTPTIIMTKRYDLCRSMRKVAVYCPAGNCVGSVEEKWGLCTPKMVLRNKEGDAMIDVRCTKRPFASRFKYSPDFEFELRTVGDHNNIGKISAEWLDLPPGAFPNQRIFGVKFPRELNYNVKMVVMTAWFLVYKLYFNGKLSIVVRHDLDDTEKALLQYAETKKRNNTKETYYDPSSDSQSQSTEAESIQMILGIDKRYETINDTIVENNKPPPPSVEPPIKV